MPYLSAKVRSDQPVFFFTAVIHMGEIISHYNWSNYSDFTRVFSPQHVANMGPQGNLGW